MEVIGEVNKREKGKRVAGEIECREREREREERVKVEEDGRKERRKRRESVKFVRSESGLI